MPYRWHSLLLVATWLALILLAWFLPEWVSVVSLADDCTRWTVRVAILFYGWTLLRWLWNGQADVLDRLTWTLGWLAYLVHLWAAFGYYHGWSHHAAMEHVEATSGWGPGIFFSHAFTLFWTLDVLWWWVWPQGHANRRAWVTLAVHGYLAFITFNAMVVYETGFIRWAGIGFYLVLASLCLRRIRLGPRGHQAQVGS